MPTFTVHIAAPAEGNRLCSAVVAADDPDEPFARVTKLGRWRYKIVIHDGISVYGPGMSGHVLGWHVWGRRRAFDKASYLLAEYILRQSLDLTDPCQWDIRKPELRAATR